MKLAGDKIMRSLRILFLFVCLTAPNLAKSEVLISVREAALPLAKALPVRSANPRSSEHLGPLAPGIGSAELARPSGKQSVTSADKNLNQDEETNPYAAGITRGPEAKLVGN